MDCILAGTAQRSNGALTVVALAHEAEVPRNALTQRHTRLKNEFYERVQERGGPSELEKELRATISKLRTTIDNKNQELNQLRADVPALVRVVNQLALENHRLRDALAQRDDVVVAFRPRVCLDNDGLRELRLAVRLLGLASADRRHDGCFRA